PVRVRLPAPGHGRRAVVGAGAPRRRRALEAEGRMTDRVRLGIVGCGDVTTNLVLPGLRNVASIATVAAVCDLREEAALAVARQCADFSPDAAVYTDRRLLLEHPGLD